MNKLKESFKKILCEFALGETGSLSCEQCLDIYRKQCDKYVNKLIVVSYKNKEKE